MAGSNIASCHNTDNNDIEIDVNKVGRRELVSVLGKVMRDGDARQIVEHFVRKGYRPNRSGIRAYQVEEENGEERYVVLIPFSGTNVGPNDEVFILYNGIDDVSVGDYNGKDIYNVEGYEITDQSNSSTVSAQSEDSSSQVSITSTVVEDDGVDSATNTVSKEDILPQDRVKASSFHNGCSTCIKDKTVCESTNWVCVGAIASTATHAVLSCGSCAITRGILKKACGHCLASVIGTGVATVTCDIGDDCRTFSECVPEELEDGVCCNGDKETLPSQCY
ncbi:hypothetical protein [Halomicrobium salinisoli]|uniref:hypothetical protein n=1 Tax=Halomicrobium salinisoli TaxID=2878391 RepID=UPI001CF07DAC|nr:hypothetical protein [Halomicrobium salinisoli]